MRLLRRYASFWSGIPSRDLDTQATLVFSVFPTIFALFDIALIAGLIKTVFTKGH